MWIKLSDNGNSLINLSKAVILDLDVNSDKLSICFSGGHQMGTYSFWYSNRELLQKDYKEISNLLFTKEEIC
jgi:hypothetical protein